MTDWASVIAVAAAGLILGAMLLMSMRRRKEPEDAELRDLEAKRDVLVERLREVDLPAEEKQRLELEAAAVLRQLAESPSPRKAGRGWREAPGEGPSRERRAAIIGFAWGAGSVLLLGGIGWFVSQKIEPRPPQQQTAPMQQPQAQAQQPDPELQGIEAAVAQRPDDLVLRNQLARAYLDRENLMKVFEQTQYVLQRAPNDPQSLTYQSLVRLAMGQSDSATAMLQKAVKADPKFLDAYVALAWAQVSSGKTADAEATMSAAARQHPDQSARLAEVLAKMREQAKAQTAEMPANHPPVEAAGAAVHVTLSLAPGTKPPAQGVIFVTARAAGVKAGPPAAAKRMPVTSFPLTFDLSAADSMMGQPLPPKVYLEARIDSDGDPLTKNPSDPVASADNVAVGASVQLILSAGRS
jgi:tetratricopeptide (TPR) repeat protein